MMPSPGAAAALDRAARQEGGRVLATLIRHLGGDFALAEDALQDAYADAAANWPRDGVPRNPGAWLTTAARRRAIDRLRRARVLDERLRTLEALAAREAASGAEDEEPDSCLEDDRLRLIFTCCHPALRSEARVALTVKSLGGLTTAQTARAFLVEPRTMERRLTRARRKVLDAGIPYRVPPDELLPERLSGVRAVVYLIFTEGHTASDGDALVRGELCDEAIRLARLLRSSLDPDPETLGLLALMLLHDSRRATRVDRDGHAVPLPRQDRTRWDGERIREGLALLDDALALRAPGPFQVEAAIAALHSRAPSFEGTDWKQIAALYGRLARWRPSPAVEVNRAVAIGFADGPRAGLDRLDAIAAGEDDGGALASYVPLHAARADLLRRLGDRAGADAAYVRAIDASGNATQRAALEARRAAG
ncbi:RNA polymerase sigma factor [Conexibacter woesei]|uniref:Putative RNA polymerase, sigma-24 subunit, ECF subfamily n=1 Tax=Conexibacter woesei (strain DSM 14684 / CCUG 47730 / CIP 108061 / JCM 11494 / NBRC 100937 / ID131577) TaxID=469383 RepID=D3F8T3_CONWI|nr:putative RNA polymerase, sigma-24 subunit, ECF subfamily [Conexibacter woesei DSM 14684]